LLLFREEDEEARGREGGRERERERERGTDREGLNLMEAEKKGRMQIGMGEVKWEELGEGRVRCVETGHEMLESEKNLYLSTKKCRRALFDIALLQRKPPLHLFQQSPISRLSAFSCLSTVFQILFLGFNEFVLTAFFFFFWSAWIFRLGWVLDSLSFSFFS